MKSFKDLKKKSYLKPFGSVDIESIGETVVIYPLSVPESFAMQEEVGAAEGKDDSAQIKAVTKWAARLCADKMPSQKEIDEFAACLPGEAIGEIFNKGIALLSNRNADLEKNSPST